MKPEMYGPISKHRWERLLKHLKSLERKVGLIPRVYPVGMQGDLFAEEVYLARLNLRCPITLFAPLYDKADRVYICATSTGVVYGDNTGEHAYKIYNKKDSDWWSGLSFSTRLKVIRMLADHFTKRGKNERKNAKNYRRDCD